MATFIAFVEFEVDAEETEDYRAKLRNLTAVGETAGFRMIRSEVHPAPETGFRLVRGEVQLAPDPTSRRRGTGYGPRIP